MIIIINNNKKKKTTHIINYYYKRKTLLSTHNWLLMLPDLIYVCTYIYCIIDIDFIDEHSNFIPFLFLFLFFGNIFMNFWFFYICTLYMYLCIMLLLIYFENWTCFITSVISKNVDTLSNNNLRTQHINSYLYFTIDANHWNYWYSNFLT